jgi:hypothetical protein
MRRLQCLPLSWTELLHPKLSWTQTPPLHHTSFTAMAAAPTSLSLRFVFCTSSPSIDHMDHSGFSSKVLLLADTDTWHWYVTLIRRLIFRTVAATWCKSQGKSCSTKWRSVTTCALSSRTRERVRERPSSGPYATTTGNAAKFTGAMLWVLLSKITIGQINPAEFTYLFFSKLCLVQNYVYITRTVRISE